MSQNIWNPTTDLSTMLDTQSVEMNFEIPSSATSVTSMQGQPHPVSISANLFVIAEEEAIEEEEEFEDDEFEEEEFEDCLLYTSPSPRDRQKSRMPSSA